MLQCEKKNLKFYFSISILNFIFLLVFGLFIYLFNKKEGEWPTPWFSPAADPPLMLPE